MCLEMLSLKVLVTKVRIMLSVIDPYILLGIGIVLIGFEAVITSFILIWFGIGFVLTALISYFYGFDDGMWQLAIASLISILLLVILRKRTFKKFLNSDEKITDNFLKLTAQIFGFITFFLIMKVLLVAPQHLIQQ